MFAFTETQSLVSYCPKKGKTVLQLSTLHRDSSVSSRDDRKPLMILDYNKSNGGVDNLDKVFSFFFDFYWNVTVIFILQANSSRWSKCVCVCVCVCNTADGSHLHLQTKDSSLADGAVFQHAWCLCTEFLRATVWHLSRMALRQKLQENAISGGASNSSGGSPYGELTAPSTHPSLSLCPEKSEKISRGGKWSFLITSRSNPQEEDKMPPPFPWTGSENHSDVQNLRQPRL